MTDHLPPELRDRVRAYVEDVAPAGEVAELESRILETLEGRRTQQPAQVMAITHEMVSERIRITPEAAAAALVDRGGLSAAVAAHIVGLPVDVVLGAQDVLEEPVDGAASEEPAEEPGPEEPAEESADEAPPDGAPPSAARSSPALETSTGGASRQGRGGRGVLIAAAVVTGAVLIAVIGVVTLGGDGGEPVAVGEPTDTATSTTGDGVRLGSVEVTADGGGAVQAGRSALLSMTVSGTGGQPATLRWELRRDGDEVFPPAPLVVTADGDVRLTIPPGLLAEAGDYLLRVSQDGTVVLERGFEVVAG